jgi:hypothetical protein
MIILIVLLDVPAATESVWELVDDRKSSDAAPPPPPPPEQP